MPEESVAFHLFWTIFFQWKHICRWYFFLIFLFILFLQAIVSDDRRPFGLWFGMLAMHSFLVVKSQGVGPSLMGLWAYSCKRGGGSQADSMSSSVRLRLWRPHPIQWPFLQGSSRWTLLAIAYSLVAGILSSDMRTVSQNEMGIDCEIISLDTPGDSIWKYCTLDL